MPLCADLGTALALAINAGGAAFGGALGKSGSAYHVEYGDQPRLWPAGATGRCHIRDADMEVIESWTGSMKARYGFALVFDLTNVNAKSKSLALVRGGLERVLADLGTGIFSHFTDSGTPANRCPGSGEWRLRDLNPIQLEGTEDADRPGVLAIIDCELFHVSPTT